MSLPYRQHDEWAVSVVVVCAVIVALILLGTAVDRASGGHVIAFLDGQQVPEKFAQYQSKKAFMPDAILIQKDTPDTWQLCAQRLDSDVVDCRRVEEVRKFLRERPAVKR